MRRRIAAEAQRAQREEGVRSALQKRAARDCLDRAHRPCDSYATNLSDDVLRERA